MSAGELLARILQDPEDQHSCLVYADAIAATDPPRGELIVVEQRLLTADRVERVTLLQRRAGLLHAHADRWWSEVPEGQLETAGGFIRGVRIEQDMDVRMLPQLVEREPLTRLTIAANVSIPPWTPLPHIRELELHGPLTTEALFEWGLLFRHGLDMLAIRTFVTDADPIRRIPPATRLHFDGCTGELAPMIAAYQHWPAIEELSLARTALRDTDLLAVVRRDLPKLRRLRLGGNDLHARGLLALVAALPRMPALAQIDLIDARVRDNAVGALSALVDACGSRITVVRTVAVPAVTTFELYNHHLEIRAHEHDQHRIAVDGVEQSFIYRDVRADAATKSYGPTAPLGALVRGLAMDSPILWSASSSGAPARPEVRPAHNLAFYLEYHHDQLVITQRR